MILELKNLENYSINLYGLINFFNHFTFRDGLMSGTGISEVTALVHSQYSDPTIDNPDLQFFFGG